MIIYQNFYPGVLIMKSPVSIKIWTFISIWQLKPMICCAVKPAVKLQVIMKKEEYPEAAVTKITITNQKGENLGAPKAITLQLMPRPSKIIIFRNTKK